MEEFSSIKNILEKNGIYTGLTIGSSMWPLIHQQKDNIIVVKPKGRLKKYDVPIYMTSNDRYIMHRIVKVRENDYVIIGDNLRNKEYVSDDMIIGVLVGFYKNGKKYIDCENNKTYKLYSRVWVALYPIRPLVQFVHRVLSKLKHIFIKEVKTTEK